MSSFGNLLGMGCPRLASSILLATGLLAVLPAQTDELSPPGLKNRWYTEGGSASRSGAVATAPLDEPPERAWQFEAPGTIVGEPLVWDDVVVFECELKKGKRRLQVLGLTDGARIAHKDFYPRDARHALVPSLWNREVIVRAGTKLKRYRFGPKGFSEQRVSRKVSRLGAPLRVDNEISSVRRSSSA